MPGFAAQGWNGELWDETTFNRIRSRRTLYSKANGYYKAEVVEMDCVPADKGGSGT
jgi:hypothetical protein